jgi:CoA-dependent NAD(P)H sulfur oxidoreductase
MKMRPCTTARLRPCRGAGQAGTPPAPFGGCAPPCYLCTSIGIPLAPHMPFVPPSQRPTINPRRIVVVGGTAAGPAAAARAARVMQEADVLLLEAGHDISYGVCELPYLLSGEIEHPDRLVVHTPDSLAREKRVRVETGRRVTAIHPAARTLDVLDVATDTMHTERYDRLILATGARARTLPVFGTTLANVFTLKSLEDARRVLARITSHAPRRATIVGAGYIGIEVAEALAARGIEVTVVAASAAALPAMDAEAGALLAPMLAAHGIRLVPSSTIIGIRTRDNAVHEVRTESETIETDLVMVAVGVVPRTELAREARIRTGGDGGILTDARQMTSVDGIHAAGDCTEVLNLVTGRTQLMPFASLAAHAARVAGENAAGGAASFKGTVPISAVTVFGHEFAQAGCTVDECARAGIDAVHASVVGTTRVGFMPGAQPLMVGLTAERRTHRLLGAVIVAAEHAAQRANVVALAMRQRMNVDAFLEQDLVYTPKLAPLRDPLLVCAEQLRKRLTASRR